MAEFDPNSFLEQEKSSEFNPDSFLEQEGEKKNSVPSVTATNGSLSESVNGGLGGIEQIAPKKDNYVTLSGKTPQTETPQQKSERLNSALTPNAKAQKNYIVAKTKYDELISNHSANPIEVDQIAKQVDYFQSRLEKPQTKENDIADEVASVLYSFNKSVSDNVVTPIAGAINLMEDLESGGGIFKKPNRTLSKTVGDVSKYYDKVSEENQPQTIVGKTAAATASAIPLIALTTMTGAGTLPFVIGGQKALTEYGNEPNKPMSLKAEEATEALGEGIKEGLEIEASMMVGGAFGKAVSQELNLGKWGSATARGVGVGAAFALPDFAKVAVENKSLDAPDKEETFVSFATGLAFEAPKFFGLIKNAVSENKVERAAKIQNLDIYNTVFSAPLEAVSEAVEIPQSSELIYKRASSFLKKENPTNEDKIAFQALTRTAGVKDLVDVIISNPEKAKEQISSSDLTPEQKSEFRKRITEINQYFNPIEVRKTELSDEIELAQKTLSDLPEPQTPIDRAENAVLTEKLQETIKKSEQELIDLVRGQIDEAMNPKVEKDGNINLEQQVEPAPPVKVEGVGDGAEAKKPSDEQKLQDFQKGDVVTFTYKTKSEIPEVLKDRVSSSGTTNGVETFRVTLPKSEADYLLAQEVKPKTESPESGSVGVGGEVEAKNKELKNIELGLTDSQHILLASEGEPIATVGNVSKIGVGNDTKIELTKEEQKEVDKYFKAYNKNLIDAADFNKWRKDFSDRVLSRRKAEVEQSLKETAKAETPTPKGNTSNGEEGSVGVGGDVKVSTDSNGKYSPNSIFRYFAKIFYGQRGGFNEFTKSELNGLSKEAKEYLIRIYHQLKTLEDSYEVYDAEKKLKDDVANGKSPYDITKSKTFNGKDLFFDRTIVDTDEQRIQFARMFLSNDPSGRDNGITNGISKKTKVKEFEYPSQEVLKNLDEVFNGDSKNYQDELKAVEQSLKETTQSDIVGVGGGVDATAKKIVGESAFDKLKKEGYTIEKGKFDREAYADFFGVGEGVQADKFANAGLRLVKPSEKIKVYRGKGKNVSEGENEGVTWVAEDKKVAENYSNDGNVEEIEVTKPKNPFPNPTDTIHVKGSDVGNKLKGILNRLFREGKVTKEQAIEASKAIDEFVLAAGEESELYSTKTNKKGVSSKYVKALQALGFDGIVQKESYNSGSPFTATKTGNETNTYGIFKAVEQSLKETTKAGSVGVGGDVKIKYGGADKDLKGNPQKQWMKPAETSEQTTNRLAEFVEASDYKGREQSAFIDRGGESVEVKLRNDDGKWNWYYPKSKKPFASFNTAKEAITFIQEQPFWDNGELNKSGRNDDYFAKVKAAQVKAELENGNIIEDINDGKISAKDAKIIIESAGLEVPKDIAEQTLKETPKAETPSSSELPNNSKEPIKGKTDDVKFTSDVSIPATFRIIESEELQPSHLSSGERNPKHLIASAQPKERNDSGSMQAQDKIAANPNLKEVGENVNAYSGAPIINSRGEVIQGNNRSIGLKKHYENSGTSYKEQLAENAAKFGLTKEQVLGMKNPILVREVDVTDQEAIRLGQHDVKDMETGGKQSVDAISTSRKISPKDKSIISSILFSEDGTLKDAIRKHSTKIASLIKGYLNPAQFRNTFNSDGSFTAKGMDDISNVVTHFLFEDGDAVLPEVFDGLPSNIQKGIQKALPHILSLDKSNSLISDIQKSMLALHDFYSSKNENFDEWANTIDMFTGESPNKIFTPIEIAIAKKLHASTKQVDIKNIFQKYEELVNGREANLIDEAVDGLSKKEAIEKQFKIKYDENKQEPNTKPESKTDDEKPAASKDKNGESKESGEGENREGSNESDKPLKPEAFKEGDTKTQTDEKGNKEAEGEGLLTPQPEKKTSFYSYLRKQGVGRLGAALNAMAFGLHVKRRAEILGKSVDEVLNEYEFGNETQTIRLNDKEVEVKSISPEVVNGFYSPLEKVIIDTKFDKLPAKQWVDKFGKGDEAKWTGLTDWLNSQQGSVSKTDIQQFLKDNRIEIVEVVKGGEVSEAEIDVLLADETGEGMTRDEAREYLSNDEDNNQTKFSQYQLEGEKSNYKEVLVTMPSRTPNYTPITELPSGYDITFDSRNNTYAVIEENQTSGKSITGRYHNTKEDAVKNAIEVINAQRKNVITGKAFDNQFKSSHFDEPNILVHLRMNTRVDSDGKRVLFLEEVQSDFAQAGRKQGFKLTEQEAGKAWEEADKEYAKFMKRMESEYGSEWESEMEKAEVEEETKLLDARENTKGGTIPQAPFVTDTNSWTKLGLKVALKEAVKQGADKIAWSTGTQQFDRWGSEEIKWEKNNDKVKIENGKIIVNGKETGTIKKSKFEGDFIVEDNKTGERYVVKSEDEILNKGRGFSLLINEQTTGATAFNGQVAGNRDSLTVQTKEELRNAIKKNLSRERNESEINKLTDRIWDRMQKEDTGTSLPRKEGMEAFYGNPKEDKLGIVGQVAKSLFKQEPKTVEIQTAPNSVDYYSIWNKETGNSISGGYSLQEAKNKVAQRPDAWEYRLESKAKSTQHSIDITPELKLQVQSGQALFQNEKGARGSWSKAKGKRLINVFENAKNTTAVHEVLGHDYLDTIIEAAKSGHSESSVDVDVIAREFVKQNKTKLTEKQARKALESFDVENLDRAENADAVKIHEWFAKAAEKYLANPDTKGISPRLKKLFDKFVTYLKDLHDELAGTKVSKPMQDIFIKAFGERYTEAQESIREAVETYDILDNSVKTEVDLLDALDEISIEGEGKKLDDSNFNPEKAKELIIALAQKQIEKGTATDKVIKTVRDLINGHEKFDKNQKAFLNRIIDEASSEMVKSTIQLGDVKALRAGVQKVLKNPEVPQEVKDLIKDNKDILEYEPTSLREGDMLAQAALEAYGLEKLEGMVYSGKIGGKKNFVAAPEYLARFYKVIFEAQTNLISKYELEGNEVMREKMVERQVDMIDQAAKESEKIAKSLAMYKGVFGHPEARLREIQRALDATQKTQVANRNKAIKMLKEGIGEREEAINDLMRKNFELEQSKEQLFDQIAELEKEQKGRSKEPAKAKRDTKFENVAEKRKSVAEALKERLKSRGLEDAAADQDLLNEYANYLFDETSKLYSFAQFAKIARKEVGKSWSDSQLAEAYKSAREELKIELESDEVIDELIQKKIVSDEALESKRALREWEAFEREMAAKDKKSKFDQEKEDRLRNKYLKAEQDRLEKDYNAAQRAQQQTNNAAQKLADKSYRSRITQVKKEALEALKEAGFKKGNNVDWNKIAVEREANPKEAEKVVTEAINKAKGLTAQDKINIKQELLDTLDENIREAKRKVAEKILKESGAKAAPKGEIDKLVELINAYDKNNKKSVVDTEKAMNKLFGVKSIPRKDAARVIELGKMLQTETLKKERKKIIDEMTFIATKHAGSRVGRVVLDSMYAGMLSGLVTQAKNATNRFDIWKQLLGNLGSSLDPNYLKVYSKSRNRGIFKDTLRSGVAISKSTVGTDRYGKSTNINELEYLSDQPRFIQAAIGGGKYVSRTMDAIDGENWLRAYDMGQYKFLVRKLKEQGFKDKAARKKAMEIMYPMEEKATREEAVRRLNKSNIGDAELKRAAYDVMTQAREKKAEDLGIEQLGEVGEKFADWLTFKGDAMDGSFELMPTIAAGVKGKYAMMSEKAGDNKVAKAAISLLKFVNAPFIDGISRIMERSGESAVLGAGGFLKAGYQRSRAGWKVGKERELAIEQANETFARALGSAIFQAAVYTTVTMTSKAILAGLGEEEDKDKEGLKGSAKIGNKAAENAPHDVWSIANGRVNVPIGMLGTDMLSAAIVGNLLNSKEETKTAVALNIANSVLSQSMFGNETSTFNWAKEAYKASNEGGLSDAAEKMLKRTSASLVASFMPYRSFIKQTMDMFVSSNSKEARGFVDNLQKYTIGGFGLPDMVDYRGRPIKMGKKYPESAAGVREMFNQYGYDEWDKIIGGLGDMDFSQRPIDKITQFKMPLTDKEYYEYTKDVKTEFGNQLTDKKYFEIIKMKADKENHKSAEEVQRDAVNDIFKEAKKTIDKRFKIKNEWGEDFY